MKRDCLFVFPKYKVRKKGTFQRGKVGQKQQKNNLVCLGIFICNTGKSADLFQREVFIRRLCMLDSDEKRSAETLIGLYSLRCFDLCVCVCVCVLKGGVRKSWCGRVEGAVTRVVLSELRKRHTVGVFGRLE